MAGIGVLPYYSKKGLAYLSEEVPPVNLADDFEKYQWWRKQIWDKSGNAIYTRTAGYKHAEEQKSLEKEWAAAHAKAGNVRGGGNAGWQYGMPQ